MGSQLLIFRIGLVKCFILLVTDWWNPKEEYRETCCVTHHQTSKSKTKPRLQFSELSNVDYVSSNAKSSQFGEMPFIFLSITKQSLKLSSREEVQQWDTLLTGCFTESIWIQRFKSHMSTPNDNSQTYWPRALSHVMSGTIFSICLPSRHFSSVCCFQNFSSTSCPETMAKRMHARRIKRRENSGKAKTDVEPGLACCDKFFDCAKSSCIEKSGDSASSSHWSIRTWCGIKKRSQYCVNSNSPETFPYLRAIQGLSGGTHMDPAWQDNVLLPDDFAKHTYHVRSSRDLHSISGVLCGPKSDVRRSAQRSRVRPDEAQNCNVQKSLKQTPTYITLV